MKRIGINLILIVGFVLLMSAIVLPFVAEVQFEQAKELEVNYRWKKAGETYQAAAHLNPFNAKYFAGAGDFMVRQSKYRKNKDKILWLRRAEKLYERACRLNPRYAEYRYLLGKVRLELNEPDGAVDDFRMAIERDPYNFRNNYLIGHNLLSVWGFLDDSEKAFAKGRLKYVLQLKPHYGQYVYPAIMYYAEDFGLAQEVAPQTLEGHKKLYSFIVKNDLWQYHKRQKELVDFYQQKEEPQEFEQGKIARLERIKDLKEKKESVGGLISRRDWQGESRSGKSVYKNGNMYWTGTMDAAVEMPEGKAKINIKAKGSPANEVFPYMIVELDGAEIGETFVDSPEWKEYFFEVDTEGGLRVLSVTFANDGGNKEKGEDRNLYVGKTQITQIKNTDYTDEK